MAQSLQITTKNNEQWTVFGSHEPLKSQSSNSSWMQHQPTITWKLHPKRQKPLQILMFEHQFVGKWPDTFQNLDKETFITQSIVFYSKICELCVSAELCFQLVLYSIVYRPIHSRLGYVCIGYAAYCIGYAHIAHAKLKKVASALSVPC